MPKAISIAAFRECHCEYLFMVMLYMGASQLLHAAERPFVFNISASTLEVQCPQRLMPYSAKF